MCAKRKAHSDLYVKSLKEILREIFKKVFNFELYVSIEIIKEDKISDKILSLRQKISIWKKLFLSSS